MAGFLARLGAFLPRIRRDAAGSFRVNWPATSFQQGLQPARYQDMATSAVFAAIDRISSDIAKIPLRHWRVKPGGGREEVLNSAPLKVWRNPNPYQTGFDLMKQLVTSQLLRGNGYVFVNLNAKNQVTDMYCLSPDRVWPYAWAGDVWYRVGMDYLADIMADQFVPARLMFHHRMETLSNPLIGISPLFAAGNTIASAQGIQSFASTFFANMSRPSGYLTTAGKLDAQKAEAIKKRWGDSYAGPGKAGATAVLEMGLEYKQLTMTAVDSQLVEQLRWTVEDIARIFQIPAFLIGDMTRMMARNSESLMRIYYSSCLMAHFTSLITRINTFWELDPAKEYLEFDLDELFRTDFDVRIASWAKAVQGGLATPNEAREGGFGFNPVEGGDEVYMQQQMLPITLLGKVAIGAPGGTPANDTGDGSGQEPTDVPAPDAVTEAFRLEGERRLLQWGA